MTPFALRVVTYLLAAGLVLAVFFLWLGNRDRNAANRAGVEQAQRTERAVTGIVTDAGEAAEVVHRTEVRVVASRDDYMRGYEDAKREAAVADWVNARVPDRLRDLARERREARERSGGPGDGAGSPVAD